MVKELGRVQGGRVLVIPDEYEGLGRKKFVMEFRRSSEYGTYLGDSLLLGTRRAAGNGSAAFTYCTWTYSYLEGV